MVDWPEDKIKSEFAKITALTINEQATFFLRSFVQDFSGNFEEVLELAEEFKQFAPKEGDVRELEEDVAHRFLERRGETMTVIELRDALRAIDLDMNKKVSFIEYALYKYKKSLRDMFTEKPGDIKHLLEKLEEAIAAFQKVLEERAAREQLMKDLEEQSQAGGVKAMKARLQLESMRNEDELARNKKEVQAGAQKRAAQRAVDNGDPYVEEQKRLAEEKKKKEAEEKAAREEARARLKAKASAFQ
eukprot:m.220730 g.220730  ORF g.220730 m.220730 type:complete len:246 (-) comp10439_c0_seq1:122-859(-)